MSGSHGSSASVVNNPVPIVTADTFTGARRVCLKSIEAKIAPAVGMDGSPRKSILGEATHRLRPANPFVRRPSRLERL